MAVLQGLLGDPLSSPSETSPKMAYANSTISGRVAGVVHVNFSHETREANVVEGQSCHASSLPQLQVIPNNS